MLYFELLVSTGLYKPIAPIIRALSNIRTCRITRARTGLSPPAGYLYKPWDRVAFKRGYQPRHYACANKHHSSLAQGHPCLSGALVLERPIKEDETKP